MSVGSVGSLWVFLNETKSYTSYFYKYHKRFYQLIIVGNNIMKEKDNTRIREGLNKKMLDPIHKVWCTFYEKFVPHAEPLRKNSITKQNKLKSGFP